MNECRWSACFIMSSLMYRNCQENVTNVHMGGGMKRAILACLYYGFSLDLCSLMFTSQHFGVSTS